MDIEMLEKGCETDALVAEKVMGWRHIPDDEPMRFSKEAGGYISDGVPYIIRIGIIGSRWHPSTDMTAALDVVEALTDKDKYEPEIIEIRGPWHDGWAARLVWRHHDGDIPMTEWADAETLPLAICRLALIRKTKEWAKKAS